MFSEYCIDIDASAYGFKNELIIPISVIGSEHMLRSFSYEVKFFYPTSFHTKCFTQSPTNTIDITLKSKLITGFGNDKIINGHVLECKYLGRYSNGVKEYFEYKIVVESFMSLLDDNVDCEIFVDKTVYEIVEKVLTKYNFVKVEYPTEKKLKKIPYTVKYDESDSYFISRILQAQGISFFFVMEKGMHTMRFYSDFSDYISLDVSCKHIKLRVNAKTKVMPAKIVHASFNYDRPTLNGTNTALVSNTGITTVYKHLPGHSSQNGHTHSTALAEEQIKSQKFINSGSAMRVDIAPGYAATIEDHTQYGIIASELEIIMPAAYTIKNPHSMASTRYDNNFSLNFKCMDPIITAYKPTFPFETPKILGTQIAVVVGNPSNYMDKYGRVKVRFQWDRHFTSEQNQIYIRVMQPSASKNAGTHFKVYPGDEVLVTFLEGEVHEPIIIGALYNGQNVQSITSGADGKMHGHMTVGGHEISHNDVQGSEEIKISSSKLLTVNAVDTHSMQQKQWNVNTTEGVKMEQKQIDVKAAEFATFGQKQFEVNSSESATHNQKKMLINSSENTKLTAGTINFHMDEKSGVTTLSGAKMTEIKSLLKVKAKSLG